MNNSFDTRRRFDHGGSVFHYHDLPSLEAEHRVSRLPFALKVLLENLLRCEDGEAVSAGDIQALLDWDAEGLPDAQIGFTPARVLLQDFTGVPAVVDLAAMREAFEALGGDPARINPLVPAELVIDHSVQVDAFGQGALDLNTRLEFRRNRERYAFLRWGQQAFDNFRVVPPGTGIVHQVNLEHLARVVFREARADGTWLYPDTLVGTDSHTTMVNALGVLGWGVGGIEAEAGMLGQAVSMLIPRVVGVHLKGGLGPGTTATDLVLTLTEMLRKHGVVGKFVEFFGDGLSSLPLADRATIANMAPEYGATCGLFPVDGETLRYLRLTGRDEEHVALVEAYLRKQGLFRQDGDPPASYSELLELDLATVEPSLAGPRRPQDRIPLKRVRESFDNAMDAIVSHRRAATGALLADAADSSSAGVAWRRARVRAEGQDFELRDGAVVIAAITSCTNTSNPAVMVAAGLVARKARAAGLRRRPWVKTSLAPGSQVVARYLRGMGLLEDLEAVGFHLVGYGCTTCIGNSGPLPEPIADAISAAGLATASVLSGNRNFEGRIHPQVSLNYLASPPLVVIYALAGTMDLDLDRDPVALDQAGRPVFLRDLWPDPEEVHRHVRDNIDPGMFRAAYASVFDGDETWQGMEVSEGTAFRWESESTYIRRPPFFEKMGEEPPVAQPLRGARVLALLGDSVTTDHISPAGAIPAESPAGRYLIASGVEPGDFNSYGSRRGNHEVMIRGTLANIRLRNYLAPGTEGGWTRHLPSGEQMDIHAAAMRYAREQVPLILIAGQEYGTGSSRDWAAKGTRLLGVRAVLAGSYERIHRSNLVGMGVLPLQFPRGETAESMGLNGEEIFDLEGLDDGVSAVTVVARSEDGREKTRFQATVRIDTPKEWAYYRHGGILHYVLRQML